MKHISFSALLSLLVVPLLVACVDFSEHTDPIEAFKVRLLRPGGFTDNTILAGRTVTLKSGQATVSATTDADGVATFEGLVPNVYDVSTSWETAYTDFSAYTDGSVASLSSENTFTFSGTAANKLLDSDGELAVQVLMAENQSIIIGKIYYATSKDGNSKNYTSGQYIELFNQSDKPVDVAGLYIGLGEAEGDQAYTLENLAEQYQSEKILLKQLFRIPADKEHVVAPGATVLIVNSAIDHTQNNAPMEHDLSQADFEAKDGSGKMTNNSAVPALQQLYSIYQNISNMNLLNNGLCSVVIFRTDEDPLKWGYTYRYPNNQTRGSQWLLLPKKLVLDGVECLPNRTGDGPDINKKRLYYEIDAGFTYINGVSGRTGEVVYRRTASQTADGRRLLMDTNNSSNDFHVSTVIAPRQYDDAGE